DQIEPDVPLIEQGLDSLVALELQHWLEVERGVRIPMARLLGGMCLSDLALDSSHVAASSSAAEGTAEPPGTYPLSSGEKALWFLYEMDPTSTAYLLARAIRLPTDLNVGALERAVAALVRRHAALRSTFASADG